MALKGRGGALANASGGVPPRRRSSAATAAKAGRHRASGLVFAFRAGGNMSVYEKVKADLARRNLELEQELETRRRNFDMVFAKIVPRLENYFNKECDSLIRDGGRADVDTELESPLRSITTFTFGLPHEGAGVMPLHSYRVSVTADRLCVADGRLFEKQADPQQHEKRTVHDELGSIDAPDFLIKLDKSFARMLELAMGA
jgi:hypothetical protein